MHCSIMQILYATNQPSLLKWLIPLGLSGDAVIALSAILFLTGGISNPFSIFCWRPHSYRRQFWAKLKPLLLL